MGFKHDEMFLQYLTMGAICAARVAANLTTHGHRIAELERYTTSNKLWATKIKRLRLPDLFCLSCGVRVEAKGKSKLAIKTSDTTNIPGREWDAGLADDDLFALVRVTWDGRDATASDWVEYFRVGDLRSTIDSSRLGPAKSAGEGAERDRTWPTSGSSKDCEVLAVTENHVRIEYSDGRVRNTRIKDGHHVYVTEGEAFSGPDRFLTGVVPKPESVTCPGPHWNPVDDVASTDPGRRYAAVKALGLCDPSQQIVQILQATWESHDEDDRIRLEALGALARHEGTPWMEILAQQVEDDRPDIAMESVLIMSEIPTPEAGDALVSVLSNAERPSDLRSAAAWGLGPGGVHARPVGLVPNIGDEDDDVALHALIAIGESLSTDEVRDVADLLGGNDRTAASAIQVLVRNAPVAAPVLFDRMGSITDQRERAWALYGLGQMGRDTIAEATNISGADRASLEALWIGLTENWLSGDRGMELDFIDRQTIRKSLLENDTTDDERTK